MYIACYYVKKYRHFQSSIKFYLFSFLYFSDRKNRMGWSSGGDRLNIQMANLSNE